MPPLTFTGWGLPRSGIPKPTASLSVMLWHHLPGNRATGQAFQRPDRAGAAISLGQKGALAGDEGMAQTQRRTVQETDLLPCGMEHGGGRTDSMLALDLERLVQMPARSWPFGAMTTSMSDRIPCLATKPPSGHAGRTSDMRTTHLARLPEPKPTSINQPDSQYERGTTGGQVKPARWCRCRWNAARRKVQYPCPLGPRSDSETELGCPNGRGCPSWISEARQPCSLFSFCFRDQAENQTDAPWARASFRPASRQMDRVDHPDPFGSNTKLGDQSWHPCPTGSRVRIHDQKDIALERRCVWRFEQAACLKMR